MTRPAPPISRLFRRHYCPVCPAAPLLRTYCTKIRTAETVVRLKRCPACAYRCKVTERIELPAAGPTVGARA